MSTSGRSRGAGEQAGEVRRRRARDETAEAASAPAEPPLSRREMKARGILLTREIPVIQEPPGVGGKASAAARAHRTVMERADAGRAVAAPGTAPLPGRRALRAQQPAMEPAVPDAAAAPMVTGRRPVVRAPLTAHGLRTVDEHGTITGVHSAVGHAVGRAIEGATSPASWESAVAMPAVALGIRDLPGAPANGGSSPAREGGASLARDDGASLAVRPGDGDTGRAGSPDPARPEPGTEPGTGQRPGAGGDAPVSPTGVAAAERSDVVAQPTATQPALPSRRALREAERREAGLRRGVGSGRGLALGIVVALAAVVVLIYLISTGSLSWPLAEAPGGLGAGTGTLAVAVGASWRSRLLHRPLPTSLEEFRDR